MGSCLLPDPASRARLRRATSQAEGKHSEALCLQGEVDVLRQEHNVRVQNIKAQHAAWADRQLQQHKGELLRQQKQVEAQVRICLCHNKPVLGVHCIPA